MVTPEVPTRATNPRDGAADILDDQRDIPAGRVARLALKTETGVEQRKLFRQQCGIGPDLCRERLRSGPGHRRITKKLARRARHNQRNVLELRAVKSEHVLDHKLRRIAMLAVDMLLDVKPDNVEALGEQARCPASEPAAKVDGERLASHAALSRSARRISFQSTRSPVSQ